MAKRASTKKSVLLSGGTSGEPSASNLESILFDRIPPSSLEAERGVVGSILLDPRLCDDIAVELRENDFYSDALRRIYHELLYLHGSASGVDVMLLVQRLKDTGQLEEVGGEAYLGEVMQAVPIATNAIHYARIVREQAIRRDLIQTSATILNDAFTPTNAVRELVSEAEERIFQISDSRDTNRMQGMNTVINEAFKIINARIAGEADGMPTGFYDLDELLGGLHGSELLILAARPAMGKTAFAMNIAEHIAVDKKEPVLFFSLEMRNTELAIRLLCSRGRIDGERLRTGNLAKENNEKLIQVASELSESPFYIDDSPSRTVTEIAAMCRRAKRQDGLGLVIIDYLGLIEPDNPADPRQEQVAKIARRLKGLARELNVPVLCLSQLNRQTEIMKDNRPRLNHLRESGAIEQDADVVMFVHREEYYHTREQAEEKGLVGKAEIIVAKQRNGPVGTVHLAWMPKFTLFLNYRKDSTDGYEEFSDYSPSGEEPMDDAVF